MIEVLAILFIAASVLSMASKRLSYALSAIGCLLTLYRLNEFDPISRYFALITFLICLAVSIYSLINDRYGRILSGSFALSLASILLVLYARDCITFLIGWEGMTLASFIAMSVSGYKRPAYVMLAFGELSAILLLIGFSIGFAETGSIYFASWTGIPILISILGFMVKMEIFPFHIWAPPSYGRAPANLAAILSGVMTLMGVYGVVRFLTIYKPPMPFSLLMIALGGITAVVGSLHAVTCEGIKELPAYSTIENDGIILTLLGAYAVSSNRILSAFALFSALFYAFSHSTSKSLLFLSIGERRRFSDLGKLSLIGVFAGYISALSLAAIPPLPGFVSEWMALETLFQSFQLPEVYLKIAVILVGAVIALAVGMSAISMSKVVVYGFKGQRRRGLGFDDVGLFILTATVLILGIAPQILAPLIDPIVRVTGISVKTFIGGALAIPKGYLIISGKNFGCLSPTFVFVFLTSLTAIVYVLTRRRVRVTDPWTGGTESGDYNSLAYSMIARLVLRWFYGTKEEDCDVIWGDVVEAVYIRLSRAFVKIAEVFRRNVMNGNVGLYVLYILLALLMTLALVRW